MNVWLSIFRNPLHRGVLITLAVMAVACIGIAVFMFFFIKWPPMKSKPILPPPGISLPCDRKVVHVNPTHGFSVLTRPMLKDESAVEYEHRYYWLSHKGGLIYGSPDTEIGYPLIIRECKTEGLK